MKNLLILFLLIGSFGFLMAQNDNKFYGEKINEKGAEELSKLSKMMKNKESVEVKLTGTILETCTKKGCWMTMDMGNGEKMMIKFKDYGFFVPKSGVNGKTAVIEGIAKKEVIDVATLKHYAEDAGKSKEEIAKIDKPEEKITFVANGVIIKEK